MPRMPKEFLKALLPQLEPGKFGSADVCRKLQRGANGSLHPLLRMALACQPRTKWPRLAQQQRIFRAMALEQRTAKSCRLQGVLVAETGNSTLAPWAECEVCTLVPEAGEAATAQHMFRL